MADGKLVFLRPASGSAKLVLGDAHAGSIVPDANLAIDAGFAGDAAANIRLAYGRPLAVDAGFAGEGAADVQLLWDANVSRGGLRHELRSHWQPAHTLAAGLGAVWQQAQPLHLGTQARWQLANTQRGAVRGHWQDAERQRTAVAQRWQQGELRRAGVDLLWQEAERLRAAALTRWQHGELRRAAVRSHWQEMLRLRSAVTSHWQQGQQRHVHLLTSYGDGLPVRLQLRAHWQETWRPRSGVSQLPKPPEPRPPCYDPTRLGLLVFDTQYTGDGRLVFICRRAGPGPDPEPPQYVIPLLEVYVSLHTLNAVLLPSLEPVALLDATIESDDGGFGWALTANGPEHLLDQLAPVSGLPARVRVTIDGIDWVFAVERVSRTRRFGQHRTSIQGRSVTALLADPYMPQQSWLNAGNLTAQQIVAQALEFTGTTIAWGIDDWLVPGGAWSFTGTPLQAALRVAESVGAVVRSHRTDAQLIYAPRYPALPWAWGGAMANVQMPAAIITTDSLEPDPRPAYNAVYVGGMAQGVLGQVRRTGTAGDLLAPQVTDALITQEVAARQRGSAVLGGAGNKLTHTMTLPLLTGGTNPGLIQPGYLIEVNDIGQTWRGLVRGIRITAGMPIVRQTITVERNA